MKEPINMQRRRGKRKIEQKSADWNKIEHKRHVDELGNGETSCSLGIIVPTYQSIPVD